MPKGDHMRARTRRRLTLFGVYVFALLGPLFIQMATKGALEPAGRHLLIAGCALLYGALTGLAALVARLARRLDDLQRALSERRERGDDT